MRGEPPRTMGYPGLVLQTGLPLRTLQRMVAQRKIPHVRYSPRVVRFDRAEIDAWIAARSVRDPDAS